MFRSLKLRILALSALSICAVLIFLWMLLTHLFERQIAARFYSELEPHLGQLARAVEIGPDGVELIEDLNDPRFARPFSGLYWQITGRTDDERTPDDDLVLTSDSLWDEVLALPAAKSRFGEVVRHRQLPFQGSMLMALERSVLIGQGDAEVALRMVVALDRSELIKTKRQFAGRVLVLVGLLAAFLIVVSILQVLFGLRPLTYLRKRLNAVRTGTAQRLEGRFPSEVQGLVNELNGLLDGREEMIGQARARASDLAHGLKTPLAVLAAESRRLAAKGETESAAEIDAQIERMNRNVERELIRARVRGAGGRLEARTPLGPAVTRLLSAFERLPGGDQIQWQQKVQPDVSIAMDKVDFDEVAGNILDNARKWATGRVRATGSETGGACTLVIEDDGPGVPPDELDGVLERGRRIDQAAPGSGLGLAIARDILELYDGELILEPADPHGLRVRLIVPNPRPQDPLE